MFNYIARVANYINSVYLCLQTDIINTYTSCIINFEIKGVVTGYGNVSAHSEGICSVPDTFRAVSISFKWVHFSEIPN